MTKFDYVIAGEEIAIIYDYNFNVITKIKSPVNGEIMVLPDSRFVPRDGFVCLIQPRPMKEGVCI